MVMTPAAEGAKAVATVFANVVIGRLDRELDKKYRMWKNIKRDSQSLKAELEHLAAATDDMQIKVGPRTAVARVYCEEIRELTHDIEDCIERFLHRITCKPGASKVHRSAHGFLNVRARLRFATEMKELKIRVEEARQRAKAADSAQPSTEPVKAVACVQDFHRVGISDATKEVRALLDVEPKEDITPDATQTPLRVVAIVGFGGSGKTTLAKAVYETVDNEGALRCAWISGHSLDNMDADGIVNHIKAALPSGEPSLPEYHKNKENRFLVVIDDIKANAHLMDYWDTLRNAFSDNGRIIVTTTSQSIANECCNDPCEDDRSSFGRVYNMRRLEEKDSKVALIGSSPKPDLVEGTKELIKKCGGLPLAVSSVARRLRSETKGEQMVRFCYTLCNDLGTYLESEAEPCFARLRDVLRENYTSLPDYTVRTCLLYLGIFPMEHPLKKNVIIRRWMAEGYARHPEGMDQSVAEENFQKLMKRSIILPVVPVSNTTGKTCRTHSILHVFMLHKSKSMKFIMPFSDQHKKVRHFFIHGRGGENPGTVMPGVDLSRVRSLTVLGNAGDAISDFSKYELTRVLDLEGCVDVNDGHLKHICKLWNLRYLSLGPNVTTIPKEIAQLKLLETLDVSMTRVKVLPVQAMGLPCLIHLIGKFKLQHSFRPERLPKECMLETIAGFVPDKGNGFLQFMDYLKRLNKLKIWCECEETEQGQVDMNKHLFEAIQKYIGVPLGKGKFRSLSLNFEAVPLGSLSALDHLSSRPEHEYHLSSLKLHGNSNSATLVKFLALFKNLTKLSISTTLSVTRHLLSIVSKMDLLSSLKMTADSMDNLIIKQGNFMSLTHLCLVLTTVGPSVITIEDEAQPEIISLELICKDLVGISGIEIARLSKLEEIVLHPKVVDQTRKVWEVEAAKHHNRPYVLVIQGNVEEASSSQEATNNTISPEVTTQEEDMEVVLPADTVCMEVELETNATAPVKSDFGVNLLTTKRKNGFHVSGAQEGADKDALVFSKKRKEDNEVPELLQNMSLGNESTVDKDKDNRGKGVDSNYDIFSGKLKKGESDKEKETGSAPAKFMSDAQKFYKGTNMEHNLGNIKFGSMNADVNMVTAYIARSNAEEEKEIADMEH